MFLQYPTTIRVIIILHKQFIISYNYVGLNILCVYHNLSQGKKELVDPFAVVAFAGHKV